MHSSEHHLHLRRRIAKKLDVYPHPNRAVRLFDGFMYVIGIAAPLSSLPQVYEIWVRHNAAGVSFFSWAFFSFASIFWVIYAVIHHDKPVLISQTLWLMLEVLIAVGVLVYR